MTSPNAQQRINLRCGVRPRIDYRARVLAAVASDWRVTVAIAARAGCQLSAAKHHLRELHREGAIDRRPCADGSPGCEWRLKP